jgi:hypothetical protein
MLKPAMTIKKLVLFDTRVSVQLEQQYLSKKSSYYDVEGGSYLLDAMTYTQPAPLNNDDGSSAKQHATTTSSSKQSSKHRRSDTKRRASKKESEERKTFVMQRVSLQTIDSHCTAVYNVEVKQLFPVLYAALLDRCTVEMHQQLGFGPRSIAQTRSTYTVFVGDEELRILHDACSLVPEYVRNEVEKLAKQVPPQDINEISLRYRHIPPLLYAPVLQWVVRTAGVVPTTTGSSVTNTRFLCAMVKVLEKMLGRPLHAPTAIEYRARVGELLHDLVWEEQDERLRILLEHRQWWQKKLPGSSQKLVAINDEALQSLLAVEEAAGNPLHRQVGAALADPTSVAHRFQLPLSTSVDIHSYIPFVLQDATTLYLEPTSPQFPSFARGDLIRYTIGDIAGVCATVLGVGNGFLWRYEHSGRYKHQALPFAGSDEVELVERYRPEKVRSTTHLAKEVSAVLPPFDAVKRKVLTVPHSNPIPFLCYDGQVRFMDGGFGQRWGSVMAGDRLLKTKRISLRERTQSTKKKKNQAPAGASSNEDGSLRFPIPTAQ